jgi:MFS family permease
LEQRATAVGLWGAAGAVSAAIGPSLGGVLIDAFGWRSVFYVNLPLGLIAVALGAKVLTESRDPERGAVPDLLGIAVAAAAMGLLTLAIVQGNDWGWGSARVIGSLVAAGALGALFVWRSQRHPAPVVELSLLRVRTFAVANAGTLIFAIAFYAQILNNVLYLTQVWGYSTLTAGLALTPGPIAGALVAGPAGRLADRYGQRVVTAPGAIIFAVAVGLFVVRVGPEPSYVDEWLPQTVFVGIGIGLTLPALTSAATTALPAARYGIGSAVNSAARQLGAVLGVALLVAILGTPRGADALDAFDAGWTFIALVGLASVFAALALRRPVATKA